VSALHLDQYQFVLAQISQLVLFFGQNVVVLVHMGFVFCPVDFALRHAHAPRPNARPFDDDIVAKAKRQA